MIRGIAGGLLVAMVMPIALLAQKEATPFSWSGALAKGRTLEVRGVNGNIEVTGVSGGQASVKAVRRGQKSDPSSVDIRVVEGTSGVTVCAVYPNQDGSGCDTGSRKGSREENDVVVNFVVQVPEGVRLEATTVNGSVDARGLTADAEVASVNGDVRLATSGVGEATTVNGSVLLELGRATWDGEVEASTVNGAVRVVMPEPSNLTVSASMLNGSFETDFPLTIAGKMSRREVRATIGKGGPELELSTVNGSIELRRAR